MLEEMAQFFEARLDGYDEHMRTELDTENEFYPFTASQLPVGPVHVLDLGCGTGLELEDYFQRNTEAEITGIDLTEGMLEALRAKFPDKKLHLIQGSYFDEPLPENTFDAAVSVESLHHFTEEQKTGLYEKLWRSLKDGGYFILTDYFADDDADEAHWFDELARIKKEQQITDDAFYHYDTPLTPEHEARCLRNAGFTEVAFLAQWGSTWTLKAVK